MKKHILIFELILLNAFCAFSADKTAFFVYWGTNGRAHKIMDCKQDERVYAEKGRG